MEHWSLSTSSGQEMTDNYRGISLLSVPGKVLTLVLLERMQEIVEPQLMEEQCGFREGRDTIDQIRLTRHVVERATEYHTTVYLCFVDLIKAYDSVDRAALIAVSLLCGPLQSIRPSGPCGLDSCISALWTSSKHTTQWTVRP